MSDLRIPLTDKNVERLPMANEGQYRARDTELRGFFVLVGLRTKTFMIQGDLYSGGRRQSVRRKIGDATKLSAREARAKAKVVLGSIANGDDPRAVPAAAEKVDAPTLREAWTRYRISHLIRKDRSVHTIHNYGDHVERLFADWLDTSLMDLGAKPMVVAERHETITIRNGPAIANAAMRSLRAIYNHARRTCRELPAENPTFGVDWNLQRRKDTALGVKDLPAWFEQLAAIPNPVRREFQLLSLLSGSRPEALKSVRLEDVDFKRRVLHLRKPKGGEARAFDIPLSRAMLESLIRLRRLGPHNLPEGWRGLVVPKRGEEWSLGRTQGGQARAQPLG